MDYDKLKYKDTKETVTLLHLGFDIVIVRHTDGKQELCSPSDVGLKKRIRPNKFFR